MKYFLPIAVATVFRVRPSWSFASLNRVVSKPYAQNDVPSKSISGYNDIFQKGTKGIHRQTIYRDLSLLASFIALPSIQTIALSCLVPTSLGYIRYEYGVSYGYGSSVAIAAALILRQLSYGSMAYWNALSLVFYGIRLNIFLLYRELCVPRFRAVREKIEERRTSATGKADMKTRIVSRTPFVLGCASLYACLAAPLFITSHAVSSNVLLESICIMSTWLGFVLAALGDLQKIIYQSHVGRRCFGEGSFVFTTAASKLYR